MLHVRKLRRIAALALLVGVLPACTINREYFGVPVTAEAVRLVRPGMTKVDVLETLGPPDTMGLRLDGSVFIYRYRDEGSEGLKVSLMRASVEYESSRGRTSRVVVFFDKEGRVMGIGRDRQ